MPPHYPLVVTLLQPRSAGAAVPHMIPGRWVQSGGGSGSELDETAVSTRQRTVDVLYAPPGLGTRWEAEIDGVRWRINDVQPRVTSRNVARLALRTTEATGDVA